MSDTTTQPPSASPDPGPGPDPGSAPTEEEWAAAVAAQRRVNMPLLFVGVRCLARYIVLPFVLPILATALVGVWRGMVTGLVLALLLVLDVAGITSIAVAVRGTFRERHPHRRWYLLAALALTAVIVVFFVNDARLLVSAH
jgi:hypothetical protein